MPEYARTVGAPSPGSSELGLILDFTYPHKKIRGISSDFKDWTFWFF
jgi:hypothetical protein